MKFTSQWLADYERRNMPKRRLPDAPHDAVPDESDLHDQIEAECRRQGWVSIHSRMDRPTTTACGVCDFIIIARGEVFFFECKSRSGKLSISQLGFIAAMEKNGRTVHVVRSFNEFSEAMK